MIMTIKFKISVGWIFSLTILWACKLNTVSDLTGNCHDVPEILPINHANLGSAPNTFAIIHSNIITGDGRTLIEDGYIIIEQNTIKEVGRFKDADIPSTLPIRDATGFTLLPGLIDAHFHLDQLDSLPSIMLSRGITSLRDPGAWIEAYEQEINSTRQLPKLYLTGPHMDMFPPAYPKNSFILRDPIDARKAVHRFADQGASAIKIYFRSSLEIIRAICETVDLRGIPATAHLEITNVYDAVEAGLDGIEHITSLGSNLVTPQIAEAYKQAILADNNARRIGRYSMWEEINPTGDSSIRLAEYLADKDIFVCPTLGAFEYQPSADVFDTLRYEGFHSMLKYTKVLFDAGVPVVVGSHSWVPFAGYGWAFHHEMELFAQCGIPPLKIIKAATLDNARFFRIENHVGTVATGKTADLILVQGNPEEDISALRNIRGVLQNGKWIVPFQ